MAGASKRPYDMTDTRPFEPRKGDPMQVGKTSDGMGKPTKAPKTPSDSHTGWGVNWQASPSEKGETGKMPGHRMGGGSIGNGHGRWK